jgi:hypothetical protein
MVRYYQAIGRATRSGAMPDFEAALTVQQRLWKVIGITALASIGGGVVVGVVLGVVVAVGAANAVTGG